ncbi:MAG: ABC transporter substrate-binding protein [Candidatus Lustribacter sp.]|jgi:NitT/TauT family transport system substrate-binding protein
MDRRTLLVAGAATASSWPSQAVAQTPATIRIGIGLNDSGLLPIYAQELGMLQPAGIAFDVQTFNNNGLITQAIVGGALDVGVVDALQVANAVIHGIPLAFFAGGALFTHDSGTLVLVTAKSSPYHNARDLEGQSVAVSSLNSLSAAGTKEWLHVNGADPAKVKLFELGLPEMNAALARGTVAAALQGEPFVSEAKADQRVLGVPYAAVAPAFYINGFVASRDWLTKNGALVGRLVPVIYQVARWANTKRAESAAIESRYTKIPLDIVNVMARNAFATSLDTKLIDPPLAVGLRYGLISRPVRSDEVTFTG